MSVTNNSKLLTGELDEDSPLFQKLLFQPTNVQQSSEPEGHLVTPKAGWCLKTKTLDGDKIFVNICTSELVLKPKDLSEDEVTAIVNSNDPTKFRIPMGIGEPHKEKDKQGSMVEAYDVVIHPEFFQKCKNIDFFKKFFIMLTFDGLEDKYKISLSREYNILKNRKSIGTLKMQTVRSRSKPVIMEMDPSIYELEREALEESKLQTTNRSSPVLSEVSTKKIASHHQTNTPSFSFTQSPSTGHPKYLVIDIRLPHQKSAKDCTLDVGEDRLLLHSDVYHLDIHLPHAVDNEETGAQFHCKNKKLTVTMTVLPL